MSKYELSLAKDYVPDWTVVDAVRELFQNALDQQVTVEGNEMFFNYNEQTQTLYIGNKLSVLDVKTLLLGASTKRNDPNTIGQFGEGYKIATLVLTRLEKKVTFYNYGAKEVWNPRFVKSRRYNGAEILTFFVDKKHPWTKVPDNNLTITIENITPLDYEDIVDSNLHLQDVGNCIQSKYGRILEEERYVGKVYVNGLFVCNYNEYTQGYDFKPEYIKIDRDRKLADSFELKWLSSKMLSGVDNTKTIEMIKKGAADVAFISSAVSDYTALNSISDKVYSSFIEEHGENAVPVIDQIDYEKLRNTNYKPILVNQSYNAVIKNSQHYEEPIIKQRKRQTTRSKLEEWLKNHRQNLSKRAVKKLEGIIEELFE
ncbi:hypothetical protein D3C87_891570 [compost metagenome]